jgi:hypothetical protein
LNILSFTSEQQRLTFRKQPTRTLFATLQGAAELAKTILRQNGVVLDSLIEESPWVHRLIGCKSREGWV